MDNDNYDVEVDVTQDGQQDEPFTEQNSGGGKTKWVVLSVVAIALLSAWTLRADITGVITLSGDEKSAAFAIGEKRLAIQIERQAETNAFQSKMNALQEKENATNLESTKLFGKIRQTHGLAPDVNYQFDELNGVLRRSDGKGMFVGR